MAVRLHGGTVLSIDKRDYEGFLSQPMNWDQAVQKFQSLSEPHTTESLRSQIIETVEHLEDKPVRRLTELFQNVGTPLGQEALRHGGS